MIGYKKEIGQKFVITTSGVSALTTNVFHSSC